MKSEAITYSMGPLTAEGALVYDERVSRKRPAVLMAPNWLGLTDEAIARAKLVAGDRYVVFVADMYGKRKRPADFKEAAALANPLRENAVEQRRRVRAAYDTLVAEAFRRNRRRQRPRTCARRRRHCRGGFDPRRSQDRGAGQAGRDQGRASGDTRCAGSGRAEDGPRRLRTGDGFSRRQMADARL